MGTLGKMHEMLTGTLLALFGPTVPAESVAYSEGVKNTVTSQLAKVETQIRDAAVAKTRRCASKG